MTIPGMPSWALPDPAPPPGQAPTIDPPLIQYQADGSAVVFPMSWDWGQGYNVPGGWDDATQINQAAAQVGRSAGGRVRLVPGPYMIHTGIVLGPYVILEGHGPATVLNYTGSGDCVFQQNPTPTGGPTFNTVLQGISGGVRDLVIDGSAASSGAVGLHTDSLPNSLHVYGVTVRHFNGTTASTGPFGTGSVALHMSNAVSFTEKYDVWVATQDCTLACLMEKLVGGSNSFRYGRLVLDIAAFPGQSGIVMQGAHFQFAQLWARANFASQATSGPANWAFLYLSPTAVSTEYAQITTSWLQIDGEIDLGLADKPQTILFGSLVNNQITNCMGILGFTGAFVPTNATLASGCFSFFGMIGDDTTLQGACNVAAQKFG